MEEMCPICNTIRIEGLACSMCGWEFLTEDDPNYVVKMEECRQYWSAHNQNETDDDIPISSELDIQDEESTTDSVSVVDGEDKVEKSDFDTKILIEDEENINNELTNEDEKADSGANIEELINNGVRQVIDVFERKLLYDQNKEKQIDRLHGELQEYKRDLLAKTIKPLITGLIFMYDDMDKLVKKFETSTEELSQEKFFKILKGIREDIEILLEEHGTITFTEDGETFNPKRQQVVQKIPTSEKEQVGNVVEHIRPGFEYGNDLIRKERVAVYVYQESKDDNEELTTAESISEEDTTANMETNNKENENE